MKIKRQICGTYFGGIDGFGTCDTKCQWYVKNHLCPSSVKAKLKGGFTLEELKETNPNLKIKEIKK